MASHDLLALPSQTGHSIVAHPPPNHIGAASASSLEDSTPYDPWKDIFHQGVFEPQKVSETTTDNPPSREALPQETRTREAHHPATRHHKNNAVLRRRQNYIDPYYESAYYEYRPSYDYSYEDSDDRFDIVNQEPPSLTERIGQTVFGPVGLTIAAVIGLPLLIGAAYWLFVVNGPTPVVRARIDEHGGEVRGFHDKFIEFLEAAVRAIVQDIEENF